MSGSQEAWAAEMVGDEYDDFDLLSAWATNEFQFAASLLTHDQIRQIKSSSRTIEFCLPGEIAFVEASLDADRRCWVARVSGKEEAQEFECFESLLISLSSGVQQRMCASIALRLASLSNKGIDGP